MTDRELWVKTCKTVGAMAGGTVLILGSMSLFLMLVVGRPTASSSSPGTAASSDVAKVEPASPPPAAARARHGRGVGINARSGESI